MPRMATQKLQRQKQEEVPVQPYVTPADHIMLAGIRLGLARLKTERMHITMHSCLHIIVAKLEARMHVHCAPVDIKRFIQEMNREERMDAGFPLDFDVSGN